MNQTEIRKILDKNLEYINNNSIISLEFIEEHLICLTKIVGNEIFIQTLKDALYEVFDQNNDKKFNSEDIKILKEYFTFENNITNITTFCLKLITIVMDLIAKFEKIVFTYNKDVIENIIFGVLIYVLLEFSEKDEETHTNIVEMLNTIYSTIRLVDTTLQISDKIKNMFKKNNWCSCITNNCSNIDYELERDIIENRLILRDTASNVKEISRLKQKIQELEKNQESE